MKNERASSEPHQSAPAPSEAVGPAEGLQASIAADLDELRDIGMRFVRRLDARADTPEGQEMLPQLNTAMVKAARCVRQVAVLQLEVAGLRQQAGTRAPAAAAKPANQNAKSMWSEEGPRPSERPWESGDYKFYEDYTDHDQYLAADAKVDADVMSLEEAMHADFRAIGRTNFNGLSPKMLCKFILNIPHPATDACIKTIDQGLLEFFFGDDLLPPKLGPGEPGALAEWEAYEKEHGLDRYDTS
jgi:hypothetical protein